MLTNCMPCSTQHIKASTQLDTDETSSSEEKPKSCIKQENDLMGVVVVVEKSA